jgi:ankyrin repeat protein
MHMYYPHSPLASPAYGQRGFTPLHHAACHRCIRWNLDRPFINSKDTVALLLERGANTETKDKVAGTHK